MSSISQLSDARQGSSRSDSLETDYQEDEEHQLLLDAVKGMEDAFALFDPMDRLVSCNEKFKSLNPELASHIVPGVTFEELLRDNIESGRIVEALGREDDYFCERMAHHRQPNRPLLFRRNDGKWLLVKEEQVSDGSTILITTDLTAFKQHEDELNKAKKIAEHANSSKSVFLAHMSHELRTPLNAIIGFSAILKDELFGSLGNEKYTDYARDICLSGQHLLELINDILDLSKIETGKYELHIEKVDIATVVQETIRLIGGQAAAKGLQLKASLERTVPLIFADERAVRQILVNLISNSLKFTPEGGCIQIRTSTDCRGDVCLVVSDNGIGIPEDKLEDILNPFVQVEPGDSVSGGGVGLGLPIVNSLIRLHGGTLEVKSKYNDWTRITMRFPKSCIVSEEKL